MSFINYICQSDFRIKIFNRKFYFQNRYLNNYYWKHRTIIVFIFNFQSSKNYFIIHILLFKNVLRGLNYRYHWMIKCDLVDCLVSQLFLIIVQSFFELLVSQLEKRIALCCAIPLVNSIFLSFNLLDVILMIN